MQVSNMQSNNLNFGMAIFVSPKAKNLLLDKLTIKHSKKLSKLIEEEQNNATHVALRMNTFHTKETNLFDGSKIPIEYDIFETVVEDAVFTPSSFISYFSPSKAIISAIQSGVDYARELTEKRDLLKGLKEWVICACSTLIFTPKYKDFIKFLLESVYNTLSNSFHSG